MCFILNVDVQIENHIFTVVKMTKIEKLTHYLIQHSTYSCIIKWFWCSKN